MVIGWTKRGAQSDQAVDQPGSGLPHNAQHIMGEVRDLGHCITRIDPMSPQHVDLVLLQMLKVDAFYDLRRKLYEMQSQCILMQTIIL